MDARVRSPPRANHRSKFRSFRLLSSIYALLLPPPLPIVSKIRDRILPIGSLNRSSRRGGKRFVGRISLIVGRYHVVTTLDDRVPYSPRAETLKRFSIRVTRVPNVDPLHLSLSPVESRVGQALPLLQRRGEHNRGAKECRPILSRVWRAYVLTPARNHSRSILAVVDRSSLYYIK